MMIPQIKSSLIAVATILVGVPLLTSFQLYASGELHGWGGLPDVINHSSFTAFMLAVGWIFFKSPFAGKITQILSTTTTASGTRTESSLKIMEPAPAPAEKQP